MKRKINGEERTDTKRQHNKKEYLVPISSSGLLGLLLLLCLLGRARVHLDRVDGHLRR